MPRGRVCDPGVSAFLSAWWDGPHYRRVAMRLASLGPGNRLAIKRTEGKDDAGLSK